MASALSFACSANHGRLPLVFEQVLTLRLWGPQTDRADIFHNDVDRINEMKCMKAYRCPS